jgi:hypothetical protein
MTLSVDGSQLFLWDAAHFQIRIINFATQTSSTLTGKNMGPLVVAPTWTVAWQSMWFNTTISGDQRWVDVKDMAVDRSLTYLYVLEVTWIRRVTLATGAIYLISGDDLVKNTLVKMFGMFLRRAYC